MINIDIPGFKKFQFEHMVLDVNGTIAKDGRLIAGVAGLFRELRSMLTIHLVTADTHGKQEVIDRTLSLRAIRIPIRHQAEAKLRYIQNLGVSKVVAVGNGANDRAMLDKAGLGICIIGPEGAAVASLLKADVVVQDIRAALEMLTHPKRLIATLRR
jgi:soluble P-type ATPase